MSSSYENNAETKAAVSVVWTNCLIWGAISLLLSFFSIGLGLIGGLGSVWASKLAPENHSGIAFLLATIISFVFIGVSILTSILSVRSFLKDRAKENEQTKFQTNEIAGIGCSVVALLIALICIIVNVYCLLL